MNDGNGNLFHFYLPSLSFLLQCFVVILDHFLRRLHPRVCFVACLDFVVGQVVHVLDQVCLGLEDVVKSERLLSLCHLLPLLPLGLRLDGRRVPAVQSVFGLGSICARHLSFVFHLQGANCFHQLRFVLEDGFELLIGKQSCKKNQNLSNMFIEL